MSRTVRFLLLGLALLWAQFALTAHGIAHAFHDHEGACLECLALPGFAAVPMQAPRPVAPSATPAVLRVAVPPAPTFAAPQPYRSRAPPLLQNR